MGFIKIFSDIFKKYHCRGLILPLFLAVFFLSSIIRSNAFINLAEISSGAVSASSVEIAETDQKPHKITLPEKSSISLAKAKVGGSSFSNSNITTAIAAIPSSAASSQITINGGSSPIFFVDNGIRAFPDSGSSVGLYRGKFLYGHRHSSILGRLASLQVGSVITITLNGISTNYVVTAKESDVPRDTANAERARYYSGISSVNQYHQGTPGAHTYALMTCAGQSLGGGEATHRTIVFVDRA